MYLGKNLIFIGFPIYFYNIFNIYFKVTCLVNVLTHEYKSKSKD